MRAKDIISKLVMPLKPGDPASLALNWMEDLGVMHLPVVDKGHLLGLLRNSDLYSMDDLEKPIGEFRLPLNRIYVTAEVHFYEVLRLAATEKLSLIPVLDLHNRYLGSITQADMIQTMASFTSLTQPGGIIVLELSPQQYSLAEISRIVEANDAKILGAELSSAVDSTKLEVTIKVNVMDLSSIIQTFTRYDFIIKASYAEESQYDALLSERFEALMRFLNT